MVEAIASIAKRNVDKALKQCCDQRKAGKEDGTISNALIGCMDDMLSEGCKKDSIEEAVRHPKSIEIVTEKVISSEILTRLFARFVKSQFRNAVEDNTVKIAVFLVMGRLYHAPHRQAMHHRIKIWSKSPCRKEDDLGIIDRRTSAKLWKKLGLIATIGWYAAI